MNRDKTIKDKNLAIKEIKKHRYQIENVDKKFLGDKEIITAALNSKNPYEWAIDPVLEFIKKSKIKDKKFIFSGFRNKDFEKIIVDNKGKVVTSISKTTDYLIVKDKTEQSGKIDKALKLNIKILDIAEFESLIKWVHNLFYFIFFINFLKFNIFKNYVLIF